jgi:hypothetical protein
MLCGEDLDDGQGAGLEILRDLGLFRGASAPGRSTSPSWAQGVVLAQLFNFKDLPGIRVCKSGLDIGTKAQCV